jgi:hypothetical protein
VRSYLKLFHLWYQGYWVSVQFVYPHLLVKLVTLDPSWSLNSSWHYCPWFAGQTENQRSVTVAKFLKRAVDSKNGKKSTDPPKDPEVSKTYPALWEYLTERTWSDGKARETATITVFIDGDEWKASINDRANHRTAFVSGDTLKSILDALEGGLAGDDLDWRSYDPAKTKFRRGG